MNNMTAPELRAMAYRMLAMADEIDDAKSPGSRASTARTHATPAALRAEAARIYALRRKRNAMLGGDLFGEAAWDMLLSAFIDAVDDRQSTVTATCAASDVPYTTALRYLRVMEERGLLERKASKIDARTFYIEMPERTFVRMSRMLTGYLSDARKQFPTDLSAYVMEKPDEDRSREPSAAGNVS